MSKKMKKLIACALLATSVLASASICYAAEYCDGCGLSYAPGTIHDCPSGGSRY